MENSIWGFHGTTLQRVGKVAICLLFLVPASGYGQDDIEPELPAKNPNASGFVNDTLPPDDSNPVSLAPGQSPEAAPYESQIQSSSSEGVPQAPLNTAFAPPDLLVGSIYQGGIPSLNPSQLLPSPIRQSIARTWEGRQPGASSQGGYNFKIGEAKFQLGMGLGVEANDNIFASETGREGDIILHPEVQFSTAIRLSDLNTLQFGLGVSYNAYMNHSDQDSVSISPGSQVAFTIYAGDFRIQLHDQFSLEQSPTLQPSVNNVANTGDFTNTIGTLVTWDLNKMLLSFGYDHINTFSTQSNAGYPAQWNDNFTLTDAVTIDSSLQAGLESSITTTHYGQASDGGQYQDSTQASLGPFALWRLTAVTSIQAGIGYSEAFFNSNGLTSGASQSGGAWYGDFTVNQRVNSHVTQSLSVGREASSGLNASYQQIEFLRHQATWNIIDKVGLGTSFYIGKTSQTGGSAADRTTQYGAGITLGWQLNSKITVSSQYQFIYEASDTRGASYTQNQIDLNFNYHF